MTWKAIYKSLFLIYLMVCMQGCGSSFISSAKADCIYTDTVFVAHVVQLSYTIESNKLHNFRLKKSVPARTLSHPATTAIDEAVEHLKKQYIADKTIKKDIDSDVVVVMFSFYATRDRCPEATIYVGNIKFSGFSDMKSYFSRGEEISDDQLKRRIKTYLREQIGAKDQVTFKGYYTPEFHF